MEAGAMCSKANLCVSQSTFDRIDSPQYFDFNDGNDSETKGSYFELKTEDSSEEQLSSRKLQELPRDSEDDSIPQDQDQVGQNESDSPPENNNVDNRKETSSDFGEDLIQAVQTLQVDQPRAIKHKEVVTSTPFRVNGIEPMQWRANSKPETRHCTKTRAFSFEERNKQMLQRKTRRIQTILQAEKEARQFRANPIPKFMQKKTSSNNSRQNSTCDTEKKSKATQTLQSLAPIPFKARSPKVLRRPAFQPNLPRQPLAPPKPFVLSSELRAKERELFDNCIKEKERLDQQLRELREAAQKRREEEEIVKMRKEMVIKAQPIRKFKFVSTPVSKRALTEPLTPIMIKRQRR